MSKVDVTKEEQENMWWVEFVEYIKQHYPNSTFGFDTGRQAGNGMDVSEEGGYLPTTKNFWIWYKEKKGNSK